MTAVRVIAAEAGGADPIAAAQQFHAVVLPTLEDALSDGASLVVTFDYAETKPHRWRNEAIAALARKHAPLRVNAVAPAGPVTDPAKIAAAVEFLARNEGVTGQLLIAG